LQSRIRIGKFLNDHEIFTSDIVEGNLFNQVEICLEILKTKYLISPISYNGIYRREKLEYPFDALREAILNAIIHRNYLSVSDIQIRVYSNKLMIINPGELFEDLTIDDLFKEHRSIPRNILIASVFYKSGQIESWGRGTLKIINECKIEGLPNPHFSVNKATFSLSFFKKELEKELENEIEKELEKELENELKDREKQILILIQKNNKITQNELSQIIGITSQNIRKYIAKLKQKGLLERIGSDRSGYWRVMKQ
jgi:ATP-dependent DNA helicase RecG